MTIRNPSRRDLLAGGALAGAALLAGSPGLAATPAPAVAPPRDPNPFTVPPPPPEMTAPSGIAKLDGIDIWYWDTGGPGPVVALHHAMTGSGHVWAYQQQVFREAGYRVIGHSRRGYRGTTAVDPAAGTAVEDFRMLLDHLKIDRCHVVGTAGGGLISGGFALHYPKRTLSTTISCSILTLSAPEARALIPSREGFSFIDLPHDFTELSSSYRALNREGQKIWADLAHQARKERDLPAQPYGGPATMEEIRKIGDVPTLLIYGASDLAATAPLGRFFNKNIPNSELVVLNECGHSAYWERPDQFNAAVLDFMKRRGTA